MAERHKLYEYDYSSGKIRLKNKVCPKCGRVMARHNYPVPRWHCGYCGYVEYIKQSKEG